MNFEGMQTVAGGPCPCLLMCTTREEMTVGPSQLSVALLYSGRREGVLRILQGTEYSAKTKLTRLDVRLDVKNEGM